MTEARLPPQNLEAERAVLGAMLRDNRTIDDVVDIIRVEDFYMDGHQKIFAVILALHAEGKPVDAVTLANALKARGQVEDIDFQGYAYLGELLDAAPTAGNAIYYAEIVREKGGHRHLIHAGEYVTKLGWSATGPASEAIEAAEQAIFKLAESVVAGEVADAATAVNETFDHIDNCNRERGASTGLRTGFVDLDGKLGALQPASLIIAGARPSVGKTSLGTAISLRWILEGQPVFFVSLEMTRLELMERMMCSRAKVDSHLLRDGLLDEEELRRLKAAGNEIRRQPLFIDHGGQQTVLRIASNARRLKLRRGLAAVIIDYLQLIEPSNRRAQRYEQVGEISRRLKALAKELNVPVICMAQLNRASEDRIDKRPRLSDLRESGSLEMDADVVVLLHRAQEERNVIELDVAKNRNGPVGAVKLVYEPKWTRFENYAYGVPFEVSV